MPTQDDKDRLTGLASYNAHFAEVLVWKKDQVEGRRSATTSPEHHAVHLERQPRAVEINRWPVPPQIRSRIILVCLVLLFGASLRVSLPSAEPTSSSTTADNPAGGGDAAMFGRVVTRIEGGEAYYSAMGHELRVGRYPAASVFNWRTPAVYLALAAAPRWTVISLAIVLYVILLASYVVYFAQNAPPDGTIIGLILSAAAAATVLDSRGRLLTETWCGILIGLSVAAYMWRAWTPGAIAGLAAIFVRELAAPYCIVCVVLAVRARRKRELGVWALGLMIFAGFYTAHVLQVLNEVRPDDRAHARSWVQFGGLSFWLSTINANVVLWLGPRLLQATSSVLLVASLCASSLPSHVRGATVAYSLFFVVAGQPFNDYWGLVSALPFALALAYGPAGLVALIRQATRPRSDMNESTPGPGSASAG